MDTIGKRIEEEPAEKPAGESDKTVLGSLAGATVDASLSAPSDVQLALPKGALIAMRKSGGLRFTSRTVVVHRDGQVSAQSSTRSRNLRPPARLSKTQLSALKRTVAKSMNAAPPKSLGQQNPDAYAYEIVARVGRRVVATEVFDGSIPAEMAGLIKELSQHLPANA
jgi:hypothetical protein